MRAEKFRCIAVACRVTTFEGTLAFLWGSTCPGCGTNGVVMHEPLLSTMSPNFPMGA